MVQFSERSKTGASFYLYPPELDDISIDHFSMSEYLKNISILIHSARSHANTRCLLSIMKKVMGSLLIFILLWVIYRVSTRSPSCLITTAVNPLNASSCHQVRIRNSDGTIRLEPRCYPLLINFADGCCQQSQETNCRTGLRYGAQQCLKLNLHLFDNDHGFVQRNEAILKRSRGAGYWLWKSYAIYRELYLARDGDVIFYSDAAANFIANISILTQLTEEQDIIVFSLGKLTEYQWTKRDTFIIMNVDTPAYYNASANLASFFLARKSLMSMAFVSEWLTYSQDLRTITDDHNTLGRNNYPGFRDHRHDQSILSLLAKKWKLKVYPDPSQWGESVDRPFPTIIHHHRSKS